MHTLGHIVHLTRITGAYAFNELKLIAEYVPIALRDDDTKLIEGHKSGIWPIV